MRWKKNFHRYHQNAVKKNFHRYQQNAVKKNFSPLKLQILQKFTALISTLILYSQEISLKYVTDDAVDYEVGHTHEVEVWTQISFFFVRIPVNAVKKKFSPQNSTLFLQKITAFSAFNAKNAGALRWKKFFFTAIHR